jgi:hypothetical protein
MTDCGKGARGRKLFFTSLKYSSALKSLGTVKSCFIIDFRMA